MNIELASILRQRGHEIVSQGTQKDILIPNTKNLRVMQGFEDILYTLMQSDTFRKSFRDWAYGTTSNADQLELIKAYIVLAEPFDKSFADIETSPSARILKYSHTFEWYISQLFLREFGARAAGFNIRLRDADPEDEFDCIASVDNGLVLVECKTGKGQLYPEIKKFVRRDLELSASHSFFIFDRDYTFKKGKEDLPTITMSRAKKLGIDSLYKIPIGRSNFYFINANERSFLATTGYSGLETRIRHMLRHTTMAMERDRLPLNVYNHIKLEFSRDET